MVRITEPTPQVASCCVHYDDIWKPSSTPHKPNLSFFAEKPITGHEHLAVPTIPTPKILAYARVKLSSATSKVGIFHKKLLD